MARVSPNAEARKARQRAEVTPPLVLDAMLAGPVECCGLKLHPLSLDSAWTLQRCQHPAFDPAATPDTELNPLQVAQLIYTFAAPSDAVANVTAPVEGELSVFDSEALAFVRRNVQMGDVGKIVQTITRIIVAGLQAAPSGGNPPKAGG